MIYIINRFLSALFFCIYFLPLYAVSFTQQDVEQYAPIINLHHEEAFAPSSVEYFFNYVSLTDDGNYTTNESLPTTSSVLPFFYGQDVTTDRVPIYALVVPKPNIGQNVTDVLYFSFFPYNRGKSVCVGYYMKWGWFEPGCIGGYVTFGNHVGDWEFMLVRFNHKTPTMIYLSSHGNGRQFEWNDSRVTKIDNHPNIFAAYGSHGLYEMPRRYTYAQLPNGDTLNDDTSDAGLKWNTMQNVVVIDYQPIGSYAFPFEWMNFTGRWGNSKRGCAVIEGLSGECELNDGPSGPAFKTASHPDAGENDL